MKLMLNGAVTLGTYDGANIEIVHAAGEENNYIFGARVEDLMRHDHKPKSLYEGDPRIRRCVDALVDGTLSDGGTGWFAALRTALLEGADWHAPDHYHVLGDFDACLAAKKQVARDYGRDRRGFAAKQWRNLCAAGPFSADRAVREYAAKIWKIR
jgi:starch phosphorylase